MRSGDPGLDRALWRDYKPSWSTYRGKSPSREWIDRKFAEFYPLSGEYADEVKERAVWREIQRLAKAKKKEKTKG